MRSYLVVGNQTLDSPELADAVAERVASGPATFHVIVPATPVQKGLTWDEDEARAVAQDRLDAAIARLRETGATVSGEIGHRDPIVATEDALRGRTVDEILLSTLPPGISRWLGQDVPTRLKGSVLVPVTVLTTTHQAIEAGEG